jgi:hypothetical protein
MKISFLGSTLTDYTSLATLSQYQQPSDFANYPNIFQLFVDFLCNPTVEIYRVFAESEFKSSLEMWEDVALDNMLKVLLGRMEKSYILD